jgi:hypothetical protein
VDSVHCAVTDAVPLQSVRAVLTRLGYRVLNALLHKVMVLSAGLRNTEDNLKVSTSRRSSAVKQLTIEQLGNVNMNWKYKSGDFLFHHGIGSTILNDASHNLIHPSDEPNATNVETRKNDIETNAFARCRKCGHTVNKPKCYLFAASFLFQWAIVQACLSELNAQLIFLYQKFVNS